MGIFSSLTSAFTGSGGGGLGKDENLKLLANKVLKSNMGIEAGKSLEDFYKTGTFNDLYTAGEPYSGNLGAYAPTSIESSGLSQLSNMLQMQAPELNRLGSNEIKELLTTDKYNPMANKGAYFDPYKANIMQEYAGLSDELDKQLAATGDFYSSNRSNQQRELAGETGRQLATLTSNLYQDYMNKRLQGAELADQMGQVQQQMDLQRIQASQTMGSLERVLADQKAKDAYNEWLRSRSEYSDLINTAMAMYSGAPTSSAFDAAGAGSAYTAPSTGDKLLAVGGQGLDMGARIALAIATQGASEISGVGNSMFGNGGSNLASKDYNIFAK